MAEAESVSERVLALRQVPMLRALSTHALAELGRAVRVEACGTGAVLMREGRSVPALGWIVGGRAVWTRDGRRLGEATRGASVGLLELVAGVEGSATAEARGSLTLARLPAERLFELLEDSFESRAGLALVHR